ncbi:UNVERIFIED_CONTAM: hypothetical protein HDU68_007584, partial [Siphonaria sp. JEL0065]
MDRRATILKKPRFPKFTFKRKGGLKKHDELPSTTFASAESLTTLVNEPIEESRNA